MKSFLRFIIGGLTVITISLNWSQTAKADYCQPEQNETYYKEVYCKVSYQIFKDNDKKVVGIVADQFDLEEEFVEGILGDTICKSLSEFDEAKKAKVPRDIQFACSEERASSTQKLLSQNILVEVKNAYQKEKTLLLSKEALTFKMKTSEDYWDGKVGGPLDAPFDLISDLNLIEIILFGSKAQWMGDVFTFPEEKQGGDEEDQVPLDQLLEEEKNQNQENQQNQDDDELNFEPDLPDCVPPDDPNADPNVNPIDPLCGNNVLDILSGEQCDDGNNLSGDGCNQYCQFEQNGADKMCIDPDAITFKQPTTSQNENNNEQNQNNNQIQCPAGTVPSKIPKIWADEDGGDSPFPQAEEYPGPNVGGTLKQFADSQRPLCPVGYSTVEITIAGKKQIALDGNGDPRCLPTQFCADFDGARDFLFGENWEDDEVAVNVAPAIEAMFCVDVIKNNRPTNPYQVIEGCIDCHISAMVDALEEALTTNVTPYKNTTSAFGLSSKYGPTFSFNLRTALKPRYDLTAPQSTLQSVDRANEEFGENEDKAEDKNRLTISAQGSSKLAQTEAQAQAQAETLTDDIKQYNWSTGAISDIEMGARVVPLLEQMQQSFSRIQSQYEGMINETAFNEKDSCQ